MKRNTEVFQAFLDVLVETKAVYITTFEITFDLWEEMADTSWLALTGNDKKVLLEQVRRSVPKEGDQNQRPEVWYLECKFYPSCITHSFWVRNAVENGEWGLLFDQISLCDLRKQNVLRCGIDLALWVYRDGPSIYGLAWSDYWTGDRLQDLVAQLAPSPEPPLPYNPEQGIQGVVVVNKANIG